MRERGPATCATAPGEPRGRILLVGWRNLRDATGEWQLIASRAAAIYAATGVPTEAAVSVNLTKHGAKDAVSQPAGIGVRVIDGSRGRLIAAFCEMREWISHHRAGTHAVVLSGVPSYPLLHAVKPWRVPICVDLHGAYEEHIDDGKGPRFLDAARVGFLNAWERLMTRSISARLVVSEFLAEHTRRLHGDIPCFVVPCGVAGPAADVPRRRRQWRERYGFGDAVIWTYLGGHSPWQCLDSIIEQFVRAEAHSRSVLWLMTPEPERMRAACAAAGIAASRVRCEALSPAEAEERLPAGDLGFLLRHDNVTNRVAFPNKFAQYVNAGLLTIVTRGLAEPARLASRGGVAVVLDSPAAPLALDPWRSRLDDAIARRRSGFDEFLARCHALVAQSLSYGRALEPFIESFIPSRSS